MKVNITLPLLCYLTEKMPQLSEKLSNKSCLAISDSDYSTYTSCINFLFFRSFLCLSVRVSISPFWTCWSCFWTWSSMVSTLQMEILKLCKILKLLKQFHPHCPSSHWAFVYQVIKAIYLKCNAETSLHQEFGWLVVKPGYLSKLSQSFILFNRLPIVLPFHLLRKTSHTVTSMKPHKTLDRLSQAFTKFFHNSVDYPTSKTYWIANISSQHTYHYKLQLIPNT